MTSRSMRALGALLIMAAACRESTSPGGQTAELKQLPRALTTAETKVVASANAFSFALFREVAAAEPNKNVFVSPLSASFSLGMTLNGARGGTFDAMRTALQAGNASQDEINSGYRGLIDLLRGLDESVLLTIANSIWYRNTMTFSPPFLDAGRTYFDATAEGLNFDNGPASLATINGWVSQKTGGMIPSILDEIRPEHVMFLINAIHFKGSWRTRFDPSKTHTATFTPSIGAAQQVPMMTMDTDVQYASVNGAELIDLPYGNAAYSMTVVLPPDGTSLDAFTAGLTSAQWDAMIAGLHSRKIPIFMPKLKMSYERMLNDDLSSLGMGVAFTDFADFSGMRPDGGLALAFVKQKAAVDINEEGTEAAAVTVTGVQLTSAPMPFRADRPYLFVIREKLSGTIMFMGKVNRIP